MEFFCTSCVIQRPVDLVDVSLVWMRFFYKNMRGELERTSVEEYRDETLQEISSVRLYNNYK